VRPTPTQRCGAFSAPLTLHVALCRTTVVDALMFMLPSVNDDLHALLKERRLSEALEVCLWAGGRAHLTLAHLFTRYQPTSARRCSNISKLTIKNRPTEWCASPEESNRRAEL